MLQTATACCYRAGISHVLTATQRLATRRAVGLVSPSASAKHQAEALQLTAWGRSRALIQALIAEAHRAFQVPLDPNL